MEKTTQALLTGPGQPVRCDAPPIHDLPPQQIKARSCRAAWTAICALIRSCIRSHKVVMLSGARRGGCYITKSTAV